MKKTAKVQWKQTFLLILAGVVLLAGLIACGIPDVESDGGHSSDAKPDSSAESAVLETTTGAASSAASSSVETSAFSEPSETTSLPEESEPEPVSSEPEESSTPEASEPEPVPSEPEPEPEPDPEPEPPSDGHVGIVYLTFDDGPSKLTPQVLDILKEYNAKATFFVVGAKGNYDIIKRAIDEGHQIAMHGNSHEYEDIYKSVEAATENFFAQNRKLQEELGIDVKIIRFPGGSSNTVSKKYCTGVMSKAAKILTDNGYNYFDWDVSSGDAGSDSKSSGKIAQNVINGVKPSKTNVVLMHDGAGHEATVEALPKILKALTEAGYEFRTITDATPHVHHGIQN